MIVRSSKSSDALIEFEQLGGHAAEARKLAPTGLTRMISGVSLNSLPGELCTKADCSDLRLQNANLTAEVANLRRQLSKSRDKQKSSLCTIM